MVYHDSVIINHLGLTDEVSQIGNIIHFIQAFIHDIP